MERLLALVDQGKVQTVIIAKLDRLTRSVKDLAELLERFQRRGVSLVSVAESLDTGSAAGRLVINIMTAVSQWEREAIGERTRDAMNHKRSNGERVGNIAYGYRLAADNRKLKPDPQEQAVLTAIRDAEARVMFCAVARATSSSATSDLADSSVARALLSTASWSSERTRRVDTSSSAVCTSTRTRSSERIS
jgi:DNA invertase Pin-like site-specific DNA recombinase